MSLRNIDDVETEIEDCKNTLIALKNEIAKIKLCQIAKISENQLNKIKDFQVTCSYEELSPSEYALYINCELKVSFTRHSITRNLHIKYLKSLYQIAFKINLISKKVINFQK